MWTPTALASEARPGGGVVWRVVEDQVSASTRKLVDTLDEQDMLESILEANKPPVPQSATKLHYLLQTPFRYDAPYPVGSRFRRAGSTEGVFYASEQIRTALAELAHYRMRFFNDSPDTPLPRNQQRLTVFSIAYQTQSQIDLTQKPFAQHQEQWMQSNDYSTTQALADHARTAKLDAIRYQSIRDVESSFNVALLTPSVFRSNSPLEQQTWFLYLSRLEANFENTPSRKRYTFLPQELSLEDFIS
ncbi:MAG: RES family NAD+ phosphorylase [Gammaproteobacteria bacterium]|nr:RES family NAD+ phosphorylase [Gammaproteobacteria bacterium]MDH5729738.1 RES family NAD+ phosphorylase [Gammaproteobacteria bacterium]